MRFENIVRQTHDLSCGAAAMATLLKYYYHEEVDERAIIDAISEFGDKEKIERDGFSMLELKQYAEKRGYIVQPLHVKNAKVFSVKLPFVALLKVGIYRHFVVVRGVDGGTVFIADPAYGNLRMDLESFEQSWDKSVLFVLKPELNAEIARTKEIPDRIRAQTVAFVDAGRVVPARPQDVLSIIDPGFRPLQPGAGAFR
jgi:predicted double-glycine peptidase